MAEKKQQEELEEAMLRSTRTFLESARAINRRLDADRQLLDDTANAMQSNVARLAPIDKELRAHNAATMSSFCYTLGLLVLVSVVFVFTYLVIRLAPAG